MDQDIDPMIHWSKTKIVMIKGLVYFTELQAPSLQQGLDPQMGVLTECN